MQLKGMKEMNLSHQMVSRFRLNLITTLNPTAILTVGIFHSAGEGEGFAYSFVWATTVIDNEEVLSVGDGCQTR